MTDDDYLALAMLEAAARTMNFLCRDRMPGYHWAVKNASSSRGAIVLSSNQGEEHPSHPTKGIVFLYWKGDRDRLPDWKTLAEEVRRNFLHGLTPSQKALLRRRIGSAKAKTIFELELLGGESSPKTT